MLFLLLRFEKKNCCCCYFLSYFYFLLFSIQSTIFLSSCSWWCFHFEWCEQLFQSSMCLHASILQSYFESWHLHSHTISVAVDFMCVCFVVVIVVAVYFYSSCSLFAVYSLHLLLFVCYFHCTCRLLCFFYIAHYLKMIAEMCSIKKHQCSLLTHIRFVQFHRLWSRCTPVGYLVLPFQQPIHTFTSYSFTHPFVTLVRRIEHSCT